MEAEAATPDAAAPPEAAVPKSGTPNRAWRAVTYALGARGGSGAATPASPRPLVTGPAGSPRRPAGTPPPELVSSDQLDSSLAMSACAIRCGAPRQRQCVLLCARVWQPRCV